MTALMTPVLIFMMRRVKVHYDRVNVETTQAVPITLPELKAPIVVLTMDRWSRITEKGLCFGLSLSREFKALHVHAGEEEDKFPEVWEKMVAEPLRRANRPVAELVTVHSPYRYIVLPMMKYILDLEQNNPDRKIAVLIPELVVGHWYEDFLHNHRANLLKLTLLARGNRRIVVINLPWYLDKPGDAPGTATGTAVTLDEREKELAGGSHHLT